MNFWSKVPRVGLIIAALAAIATPAMADTTAPVYSQYGGVGLIKTRSARMAQDSTLSTNIAWNKEQQRYALTFQAAPWLETTWGYSGFTREVTGEDTFDRQFDVKIRLWEEDLYMPALAVGLQDFLGTGLFSSEYVVASKRFGDFDVSVGLGWGTLSGHKAFENPLSIFGNEFNNRVGTRGGGNLNLGQYLRGEDVGIFGGVVWDTPVDGLRVIAEYDSDNNSAVSGIDDSPFNFGIRYNPYPGIELGASVIAMDEFSASVNFSTVTGEWAQDAPQGDPAPLFFVREEITEQNGGADGLIAAVQPPLFEPVTPETLGQTIEGPLQELGIEPNVLQVGASALRLSISNKRYRSAAKAVGRTARILSRYAPAGIETFQIVIEHRRMQTAEFKISRTQLEDSARAIGYSIAAPALGFAYITPGSEPVDGIETRFMSYPKTNWSIGPNVSVSAFDPDDPLRAQVEALAQASIEPLPGLVVSGAVSYALAGNFDDSDRPSDSVLPRVRSDIQEYNRNTDIALAQLTGEYYFDLGEHLHAKVIGGYLESMFAGIGGEVLFRPKSSRLAWGAELFYARQREFDTLLRLRDYDVVTGHASVYYDTGYHNWNVALHAGRYLAGDYGATLELSRRFPNGWEVGAFATLTDVPFDEFGEGSFDKGITLSVPFDWGLQQDSRQSANILLRPIQRDGGQRLSAPNRLYRLTQDSTQGEVASQWRTFAH